MVIDSYVVRRWADDASDSDLLVPLSNELELLNRLKDEMLRIIRKEELKELPTGKEA